MKASQNQQSDLLVLGALDQEIIRTKNAIRELAEQNSVSELRVKQREVASALIDSRNALDSVQLELKRAETDLALVDSRIAKDDERLSRTSSAKDAQGIAHELEALKKRKNDLEDLELAVMQKNEDLQKHFETATLEKLKLDSEIQKLESTIEAELLKLQSGLGLQETKRTQQAQNLPADLLDLYEKKSARSIAVGRLLNRECGACRMTIGATSLAEIEVLPSDEIAICPECQAILVR